MSTGCVTFQATMGKHAHAHAHVHGRLVHGDELELAVPMPDPLGEIDTTFSPGSSAADDHLEDEFGALEFERSTLR